MHSVERDKLLRISLALRAVCFSMLNITGTRSTKLIRQLCAFCRHSLTFEYRSPFGPSPTSFPTSGEELRAEIFVDVLKLFSISA